VNEASNVGVRYAHPNLLTAWSPASVALGITAMNEPEERFYEEAALEVSRRQMVPGVMAKAFSEADGDEKKAIARYIGIRAAQLNIKHDESCADQARKERQERDAARATELKSSGLVPPEDDRIFMQTTLALLLIIAMFVLIALFVM
jgi:hypothetical protein